MYKKSIVILLFFSYFWVYYSPNINIPHKCPRIKTQLVTNYICMKVQVQATAKLHRLLPMSKYGDDIAALSTTHYHYIMLKRVKYPRSETGSLMSSLFSSYAPFKLRIFITRNLPNICLGAFYSFQRHRLKLTFICIKMYSIINIYSLTEFRTTLKFIDL